MIQREHVPCEDADCKWVQLPANRHLTWRGDGPDPTKSSAFSCQQSLAECHGNGRRRGDGASYAQLNHYQQIEEGEFDDYVSAVYDDLQHEPTWPVYGAPENDYYNDAGLGPGFLAGRGWYDTSSWNATQFDSKVCIGEHGCWTRSEVNYMAQGMWGAQSGESLEQTLSVSEWWNQDQYNHPTSAGELYWTEYGWNRWHQMNPEPSMEIPVSP